MKVLLRADLDPFGGDAIGLITTLVRRGADISLDPGRVTTPLPADIAVLLTKDTDRDHDLILHLGSLDQLGLDDKPDNGLAVAWASQPGTVTAARLDGYDLVIGYDAETTAALQQADPRAPVTTIGGGYVARDWLPADREWHGKDFGIAVIGEPHAAVTRAVLALKDEYPDDFAGVDVTVQTTRPAAGTLPGIRYVDGRWDTDSWHDFYADHHVLVVPPQTRPTRALQFLSTAGTVIATRAAAASQWLSSSLGYPVDWDMSRSAATGADGFKQALHDAVVNRDQAKLRGETASRLIPEMCGWDPVIDRLLLVIADQIPGAGERLAHNARVAEQRIREKRR